MYKFLLLIGLQLVCQELQAQSATTEALDRACSCLQSNELDSVAYERLQPLADSCLQVGLYTNLTGVLEEQNATLDNDSAMIGVAQKMYTYLNLNCPAFRTFAKRTAAQRLVEIKASYPKAIGLLYELDTESKFPTFGIITTQNELLEVHWIQEFDGSARFFSGLKGYENTLVEITWRPIEIYEWGNTNYTIFNEIYQLDELQVLSKKETRNWIKKYKKKEVDK